MRWVDLFAIDTFLASGQRVTDPAGRGAVDPAELDDGDDDFADVLRDDDGIAQPLDGNDDEGDEWDAETLDEIPEALEEPGAEAAPLQTAGSAVIAHRERLTPLVWPVHAVVRRRAWA